MLATINLRLLPRLSVYPFVNVRPKTWVNVPTRSFATTPLLEFPTHMKPANKTVTKKVQSKKATTKAPSKKAKASKDKIPKKKPIKKPVKTTKRIVLTDELKPPKRPVSGYLRFHLETIRSQGADTPVVDIREAARRSSELWKELPEDERQAYNTKSTDSLQKYKEDVQDWLKNVDSGVLREVNKRRVKKGQKAIRRNSKRPGSITGFIKYSMEYRKQYVAEHGPLDLNAARTVVSEAAKKWNAMTENEKETYKTAARIGTNA